MIAVVGLSHLGILTSAALAARGLPVVAYDDRAEHVARLERHELPFFEPGLAELLAEHGSRWQVTADATRLAACDVVLFALDVATDDQGQSDVSALERLLDQVLSADTGTGTTYVVLSQVAPGFTRRLVSRYAGLAKQIYYLVETLVFGIAVERAMKPERFIIGCPDPHAPLPSPFSQMLAVFGCPLLPMRYESAELTKIAINLFLTSSVSTTNTLAEICEGIGADWSEMAPALRLDRRIGPYAYLSAGLGIAGGNLERDLATTTALSRAVGSESSVVDAWRANSRHCRDWALRTLHRELNHKPTDQPIAVWGLAYKQDTTSTKNSPALHLIATLAPLPLRAYDPQAKLDGHEHCRQVASPLEACDGAAALVVMAAWAEFRQLNPHDIARRLAGRTVIDPYGMLAGDRCVAAGLDYFRLGTSPRRGSS